AVEVEDHPLSYADFEGTIPEGHYGAGHVAIYDEGTWTTDEDPEDALKRGSLDFTMKGKRLKGAWKLVRTRGRGAKPQWLLFKRSDDYAGDYEADDLLEGVPVAAPARKQAQTNGGRRSATAAKTSRASAMHQRLVDGARSLPGARRAGKLDFVAPMLTTAAKQAPEGEHWLHEWKWDGYRLIAAVDGAGGVRLWSRNGLDWSGRVPELMDALAELDTKAVFDGELIAVDARGYSDFNALQGALKAGRTEQLRFAIFDLMRLGDIDLTGIELRARKTLLHELLQGTDPRLFYSDHVVGNGDEVFAAAHKQGMEGIISKRAEAPYRSGRGSDWLKVKTQDTREFIAVGYTQPKGSRKGIGSLLLAQPKDGQLVYVGRVGSGLSDAMLAELPARLKKLETSTPVVPLPRHTPLPPGKVHWIKPQMVVEVIFRGWGKEGLLRQASFSRLRDDRTAAIDTVAADIAQPEPLPTLTSPDRIVYPDIKATKQQVYDYYLEVGERLLKEIGGRLLSIVRCPDGIAGQRFFQKHAGRGFGDAVKRIEIREADGGIAEYFYVDDITGVLQLVQMNAIEFHPWGSRVDDLERPDRMVFDLDPELAIAWKDVRRAAIELRDRLATMGLPSFPRLSGGKGVHVVVPLKARADWDEVHRFCEEFAAAVADEQPERYVATMSKAKRGGRIFIDWLRNTRGATSIAAWSLRARAGAPAAMLLSWDELTRIRRPDRYSIADAAGREFPAQTAELIASAPPLPGVRARRAARSQ
ncbi:MAG TPA: DNA ligase D, partial [Lysobacter sp.]